MQVSRGRLQSFSNKVNAFYSKLQSNSDNRDSRDSRNSRNSKNWKDHSDKKYVYHLIGFSWKKYGICIFIVIAICLMISLHQSLLPHKIAHEFHKLAKSFHSTHFVSKPLVLPFLPETRNDSDNEINDLEQAKRIVSKQSAVITGMVKDGALLLLGTLVQIEKLLCHFDDVDIVILENNSQDNSSFVLDVWGKRPLHCDFKNVKKARRRDTYQSRKHILHPEKDPAPRNMTREDRFVFYRNYLLDYVINSLLPWKRLVSNNSEFVYDYWMMVDFDVQGISQNKIFEEFSFASQLLNVDVFCVNGIEWTGRYRDSFATIFYDGQWCYDDGVQCHIALQKNRFTHVRSCFGGLTIYRFAHIFDSQCRYHTKAELKNKALITNEWFKSQVEWDDICEHIAFHDCLSNRIDNFTMAFSRDSYLFYGFDFYAKWTEEDFLHGTIYR